MTICFFYDKLKQTMKFNNVLEKKKKEKKKKERKKEKEQVLSLLI